MIRLDELQRARPSAAPPVVFAGPSVEQLRACYAGRCEFRGPIRRGDLAALVSEGSPRTALLVDGLFGGSLAVTPSECREALERGWRLVGTSSIGALRASELWSIGMIGMGTVYQLLRLGVIESDAELAVAYHAESFRELTVSLVHVRLWLAAVYPDPADQLARERALELGRSVYWAERTWGALRALWQHAGMGAELLRAAALESESPRHNPKPADAALALRCLLDAGFASQTWREH